MSETSLQEMHLHNHLEPFSNVTMPETAIPVTLWSRLKTKTERDTSCKRCWIVRSLNIKEQRGIKSFLWQLFISLVDNNRAPRWNKILHTSQRRSSPLSDTVTNKLSIKPDPFTSEQRSRREVTRAERVSKQAASLQTRCNKRKSEMSHSSHSEDLKSNTMLKKIKQHDVRSSF